ncbi:hypothetical protein [Geobacter sp. AOG1]|uniref:hypothetical protein n=1 Tax=Geobacter sp. AOG1 TaxID=1566346 RepID=UPI001CC3CA38|nr:hypothetical protein [Geobacter sp. AOG1]GFE57399.1 hypothetical protein AOG1_12790 [Geobacter sp. AOG1]
MNSSIKLLRQASSWQVISYLLLSLLLVFLPVTAATGLSAADFLGLLPTKIFVLLLFLASLMRLIRACGDRSGVLFPLGFSVVFLGLLINYAFSFTGITTLGPGEEFAGTGYERTETGIWGWHPKLRFKVEKIEGGNPATAVLKLTTRGKQEVLPLAAGSFGGRYLQNLFSYRIRALKTGIAPQFVIASQSGTVLDSTLVKAGSAESGNAEYFRSPALPHRMYFKVANDVDKPIALMITRGKLTIQDWKTLKQDEKLEFEGFVVYFSEVVKWVEIEVSSFPGNPVIFAGALIILVAGVSMLLGRKKRKEAV